MWYNPNNKILEVFLLKYKSSYKCLQLLILFTSSLEAVDRAVVRKRNNCYHNLHVIYLEKQSEWTKLLQLMIG